MKTFLFDMEVYPNYTLLMLKELNKNHWFRFELFNGHRTFVENYSFLHNLISISYLCGFNCTGYDQHILKQFLNTSDTETIYNISQSIIVDRQYYKHNYDLKLIDLMKISPAIRCGLKVQGARIHSKNIQELPIPPGTIINDSDRSKLVQYCMNDIHITEDLYSELEEQVKLRFIIKDKYNEESVLYKSDPQIAETIILKELGYDYSNRPRDVPDEKLHCEFPEWLSFSNTKFRNKDNTDLNEFLNELKSAINSTVMAPDFNFKKAIHLDGMDYQFGIGGLHSTEKQRAYVARKELCSDLIEDEVIVEADVTSLYPSIIINEGVYPSHIGHRFLDVYKKLYAERLEAKRSGDKSKSDMLKLVLNGTFGKFDNKYSSLYSTNCLLKTTLTGQLLLLMLIDMIGYSGGKVISANTDSVTVVNPSLKAFDNWQAVTNLNLEFENYKAIYSHSVNNYIAIKKDGGVKVKGRYVKGSLRNNCKGDIITEAVKSFLNDGTPLIDTLKKALANISWGHEGVGLINIEPFILMGYSKEGIEWNGVHIGKCIRYILSDIKIPAYINKIKKDGTKAKLPNADSILPIMDYKLDRGVHFFNKSVTGIHVGFLNMINEQLFIDKNDINNCHFIDLKQYEARCEKMLHEIGYYGDKTNARKRSGKKVRSVCKKLELALD